MIPEEDWLAGILMEHLMKQENLTVCGTGTTPDDTLECVCIDGTVDLIALAKAVLVELHGGGPV